MRKALVLVALALAACSKEAKAPVPAAPPKATSSEPATQTATLPMDAEPHSASYDAGMEWFRTNRGFRFNLAEGTTRVEGAMVRPTPGAERVLFKSGSDEWIGATKRSGVVWYRRQGTQWVHASAPADFDRLFQRVTLYFDPQKREGVRSFVAAEAIAGEACNHYRFTNANNGDVHDVWVSRVDNRVARLTISGTSDVTLATETTGTISVPSP